MTFYQRNGFIPGASVKVLDVEIFRIKPDTFETWQGVGWARRYWVEDTGGATYEEAHAST